MSTCLASFDHSTMGALWLECGRWHKHEIDTLSVCDPEHIYCDTHKLRKLANFINSVFLKITFEISHKDGNFKLVVSYFGILVSLTTSKLVMFFNISSQGECRRRFTKFIANISQRYREHVSLGMLYGLKTCFTWMPCFWTAAVSYLIEEIRIHLNVTFRDLRDHIEQCRVTVASRYKKSPNPCWTVYESIMKWKEIFSKCSAIIWTTFRIVMQCLQWNAFCLYTAKKQSGIYISSKTLWVLLYLISFWSN